MQSYFYSLADRLTALLRAGELITCTFDGEDSDFVRFNAARVRQAGHVAQRAISLDLIHGTRHATARCNLSGSWASDRERLRKLLDQMRELLPHLEPDPHLDYAREVQNSECQRTGRIPSAAEVIEMIGRATTGLDLVGVWASGTIYSGFANSLGQRNWDQTTSFHFDWSGHHTSDKAVKSSYAGFDWDAKTFDRKMQRMRDDLEIMARPARVITPGQYRVYLAPAALQEILAMMSWGGFSLKSHRTRQTPLIKMVQDNRELHPGVSLYEHHGGGLAPGFTAEGFIKPERVTLIDAGRYRDCLAAARSAREYGVTANAGSEIPESLEMAGGDIPGQDVLTNLDTGIHINNLWYCNFSDRNHCRITGMTRFACFWVESGAIQAPIEVMRFDETIYRMLGEQLIGLTRERDFLLDSSTYGRRSTASARLPGALVDAFTLTL